MSNLVAVAYPDEATAGEVAQALIELQKEHSIELDDLAVAVRKDDGKIKLRQSFKPVASGATGGALWGPRISQYGGDVIHSSLSQEAEETLQEALRVHATA
jgi:uncharacterized membrane protein